MICPSSLRANSPTGVAFVACLKTPPEVYCGRGDRSNVADEAMNRDRSKVAAAMVIEQGVQMSVEPSGALGFPSQAWPWPAQHWKEGEQDACTAAAGGQRSVGSLQRQIRALLYKNLLILRRNWVSTVLRLLSCVFFMFLMWVIIGAVNRHTFSKVLPIMTLCCPEKQHPTGR